jgi:hypothetical protein
MATIWSPFSLWGLAERSENIDRPADGLYVTTENIQNKLFAIILSYLCYSATYDFIASTTLRGTLSTKIAAIRAAEFELKR